MSNAAIARRIRLKEQSGWFAAGVGCRRAIHILSDGAFKLFVWISLEARRESGQLETTHRELAHALRKSKRAVGKWAAELEAKGVCRAEPGTNQHYRTRFEICDQYWPYERTCTQASTRSRKTAAAKPEPAHPTGKQRDVSIRGQDSESIKPAGSQPAQYVESVREWFLSLGCVKASFRTSDKHFAQELDKRGVPLRTVENALLLGAVRKYESWLSERLSAPIGSLRYFEPVIEEAAQLPFADDYRRYLRGKITQYSAAWNESKQSIGAFAAKYTREPARASPAPAAGAREYHQIATGGAKK